MDTFSLIIGLGNPGRQYEGTRHNVGFMVLDRLAAKAGVAFESKPKWQSHLAKLPDGTLLLKPQSFMNLSGRPVQQILAFHKWTPDRILVVYDDAALPLGSLRFREKGSHGGHNGIRSLLQQLGTDVFPRLKFGIGGSAEGEMVGHVLGNFRPEERDLLENTLASAVDAVQVARSQGVAVAANRFNTRSNLPPTP
ncbi:aminoacyl-tRNA hydrolase [Luteolibacter sp. LG18]|uniref:aminoacyl-tRNA hydrolase n=1 Tax=Luteolibacter sp. LG18 TaxID=2819286 RepID=UPI002B28AAB3|nr:peptidyl-tRNA hydrolase [Luteolibacter sp. LG18]